MGNLLRHRALAKIFGDGLTGAAAATAAGWLFEQLRDAVRKDPQRLDVSRLRPGETYLVTTRPAMSRAERRLDRRVSKLERSAARHGVPSRRARRTGRAVAATRRRLDRSAEGSRRHAKLAGRAASLETRLERQVALAPRARRRAERLEASRSELRAVQQRTIDKARTHARPARARRFL